MTRTKIDYGIDLGTTNSSIARMENGKPKIKKTDILKDTMPSSVRFTKKQSILVGDRAWDQLSSDKIAAMKEWNDKGYNTFIEFKRTMGTDYSYYSSNMNKEYNSEELSSEVLKTLKAFITDEDCHSAVITVPAQFDIKQKDATSRAAKLAGFKNFELLMEPVAASMAYGLDSKNKNGYWIVFDFGGGTFDSALVKTEDGIIKIVDTDGDNHLGGKNIDLAIVDEIIIPYLKEKYVIDSILSDKNKKKILREAMKFFAEEAKIQLSFNEDYNILSDLGDLPGEDDNGEKFELDITITRKDLKKVIEPIFQKATNITNELLKRNNLSAEKLDSLILVGGPTRSTILQEMLEKQIKKTDTSVDPMTAVAVGAALYASTVDISDEIKESTRDKTKIQLDLGYEATTVETEAWVAIKTLPDKTEGVIPENIFAEISRSDKDWDSGKTEINDKGEIIEVNLLEGKSNNFKVTLYDKSGNRLPCQPDQFTIIQGIGGTDKAAVLTHNIGIEADTGKSYSVFMPIKGLEKNTSIPAKGKVDGLMTKMDIRPGNSEDYIEIPLYQGDHGSEDSRAIYNNLIYKIFITGDELPALLPENSEVDLTITTDKGSGRPVKLEAYFPYLDYTLDIPIPEKPAESIDQTIAEEELKKLNRAIERLKHNNLVNQDKLEEIEKDFEYQKKRYQQGESDMDRRDEVMNNIKKQFKEVDKLESNLEWPLLEKELKEEFEKLEKANTELGNEKTDQIVSKIRNNMNQIIEKQDIKLGKDLLEEIKNVFFALTFIYQLVGFVRHFSENFDAYPWKDRQKASQLIDQAERIIAENPTKEELHPIVKNLINLLPREELEKSEIGRGILFAGQK